MSRDRHSKEVPQGAVEAKKNFVLVHCPGGPGLPGTHAKQQQNKPSSHLLKVRPHLSPDPGQEHIPTAMTQANIRFWLRESFSQCNSWEQVELPSPSLICLVTVLESVSLMRLPPVSRSARHAPSPTWFGP